MKELTLQPYTPLLAHVPVLMADQWLDGSGDSLG